jgi:alanine racemase
MARYSVKNIIDVLQAKKQSLPKVLESYWISQLLTDSRRLRDAEHTVFVAIKTERNDGAKYISELYKKGVRVFIVQEQSADFIKLNDAVFINVDNSLKALQKLVEYHRKQFDIPVIGITGSNGKTIVKEWIFELLKKQKRIVRSPRSYNSQIGVPLSVWLLEASTEIGVFEAGISRVGEMGTLQKIIRPNIGIFTNIGEAHQENFIDYKHKISEKIKLFEACKTIIYCKDNQLVDLQFSDSKLFENSDLLTWSEKHIATLRITSKEIVKNNTEIIAQYRGKEIQFSIPFTDAASFENLMHISLLLLHLGYNLNDFQNRYSSLTHIAMRMEQKQAVNNCTIINDSYNSDIGSLSIALDFFQQQYQHQKRTLILSDILQSGRQATALYKDVAELLKQKTVNRFIGIGKDIMSVSNLFGKNAQFFESTDLFLKHIELSDFKNEAILIKGARKFEFEKISNFLQNKSHETILEVNLSNLLNNVNFFRSKLNPKVKLMAMVKAFSYGAGSAEVANILQFHNVEYLAVAYADEGVALREAGISLPIMVMNPEEMSMEQIIRYRLQPEIYSFRILYAYYHAVRDTGTVYGPMHIKLETGMNRLGFSAEDVPSLIEFVKSNPTLQIVSVFSHLAGSDNEIFDDYTNGQIALFTNLSQQFISNFDYPILRHIANSNAIIRHPSSHFDMVRLGIGMYGLTSEKLAELQEVNRLTTRISQIKEIREGDTIGYDRKGSLKRTGRIAILPIGYADGIPRRLSNGVGKFLINNSIVPIVGNVCMDMCMVDVSDIKAKEGDEVVIFGPEYSVENVAKQIGTISYEVLTGISQRVKRVYVHE